MQGRKSMIRNKYVVFVATLFVVLLFMCGTSHSQDCLFGVHSPSLVYSPVNHSYRSVFLSYSLDSPFLLGSEINPWGNWIGGDWITTYVDEHSSPILTYDDMNNQFFLVWIRGWPYVDLYGLLTDYNPGDLFNPAPLLISTVPGIRTKPMVFRDSVNGGYLVTWLDERTSGVVSIYGQLIGDDGELQGTEFIIVSGLSREYSEPSYSVAYDTVNQRFLVAWIGEGSIRGQFINANGTLQGEEFSIGDPEFYDPVGIPHVAIAYDGINQKYLVVWDSMYSRDIYGLLVSANGTAVGAVFPISTYSSRNPTIAFDHINQRFLVAWTSGVTDGQFVNPDGTLQGERLSISHNGVTPYHYDDPPAIAFNSECGNFLVASVSRNDAGIKGIWAINSKISYTVVGDPCPSATLTVKMKGYGGKRRQISGAGMNCIKNICNGMYLPGSEVSISGSVDGDGRPVTWTGCDTIDDNNSCYITMSSDKNVTAKFARTLRRKR